MPSRRSVLTGGPALLALAACGTPVPIPVQPWGTAGGLPVVVGASDFEESVLVAELYAQTLESAGFLARRWYEVGPRESYVPLMVEGRIDVMPEFSSALLGYLDPEGLRGALAGSGTEAVRRRLDRALLGQSGIGVLQESRADVSNVLVMEPARAARWGVTGIQDLAGHPGRIVIGGAPEFRTRAVGLAGLRTYYGIDDPAFVPLGRESVIRVDALEKGEVDIVVLARTDYVIEQRGLLVLDDPMRLFGVNEVVPLVRRARGGDLRGPLDRLSAALTTEALVSMLRAVAMDAEPRAEVAAQWLWSAGVATSH